MAAVFNEVSPFQMSKCQRAAAPVLHTTYAINACVTGISTTCRALTDGASDGCVQAINASHTPCIVRRTCHLSAAASVNQLHALVGSGALRARRLISGTALLFRCLAHPTGPVGLLRRRSSAAIVLLMQFSEQTYSAPIVDGSRTCAFFDVDGTLLRIKSMFDFRGFLFQECKSWSSMSKELISQGELCIRRLVNRDRAVINRAYYRCLGGYSQSRVRELGSEWFRARLARNHDLVIDGAVEALYEHRREGAEIVLVSGSFPEILGPVAEYLGGATILSTRLEVKDGRFTGNILDNPMIGPGKRKAVEAFLRSRNVDARLCAAYGDHWTDLDMLKLVGAPAVVAGDPRLERYAAEYGWRVIKS